MTFTKQRMLLWIIGFTLPQSLHSLKPLHTFAYSTEAFKYLILYTPTLAFIWQPGQGSSLVIAIEVGINIGSFSGVLVYCFGVVFTIHHYISPPVPEIIYMGNIFRLFCFFRDKSGAALMYPLPCHVMPSWELSQGLGSHHGHLRVILYTIPRCPIFVHCAVYM